MTYQPSQSEDMTMKTGTGMLIGEQRTGRVDGLVISGSANQGLSVTVNGAPARLAVIDENGHTHAAGGEVARELFAVAVNAYRDFLRGEGHLLTRRCV